VQCGMGGFRKGRGVARRAQFFLCSGPILRKGRSSSNGIKKKNRAQSGGLSHRGDLQDKKILKKIGCGKAWGGGGP